MSNLLIRNILLAGAACSAFLLHGCAMQPIPEPIDYYKSVARKVESGRTLLVVSGCALRDEVGDDYFLTSAAESRARQMAKSSGAYLSHHAAMPVTGPVIMMCGGYRPSASEKLLFTKTVDTKDKATIGRFPAVVETAGYTDPQSARTLHSLFDMAYTMPNSAIAKAGTTPPTKSLENMHDSITALQKATNADYVWLVAGDSLEISTGKVVGTAVLTAIISLGTVASVPTGGSSTMVALVDLKTQEILWRKKLGTLGGVATTTAMNTGARTPTMMTSSSGSSAPLTGDDPWAASLFSPLLNPLDAPAATSTATAAATPSPARTPLRPAMIPTPSALPPQPVTSKPAPASTPVSTSLPAKADTAAVKS